MRFNVQDFTMEGLIEKITAYPAKGEKGKDIADGRFIKNLGLEGDWHAKGGQRQISLFLTERAQEMNPPDFNLAGLCLSRFSGNISISGLAASSLKPGVLLSSGDVLLEITGEGKRCHEECKLEKPCPLAGLNLFARVIKSGSMRAGERIGILDSLEQVYTTL